MVSNLESLVAVFAKKETGLLETLSLIFFFPSFYFQWHVSFKMIRELMCETRNGKKKYTLGEQINSLNLVVVVIFSLLLFSFSK